MQQKEIPWVKRKKEKNISGSLKSELNKIRFRMVQPENEKLIQRKEFNKKKNRGTWGREKNSTLKRHAINNKHM